MDIRETYKQLTNVDIEQQKKIWDERGKGYYGEYLLFCNLYSSLTGNGKILMNLNVPVNATNTTEIDLVLVHETGLYVFEIKHYKGTIYGKDTDAIWTQFFRTVKNNTFKNPILQNEYHINALEKLFPDVPIHSCIVFTSNECDNKVINSNENVDICYLDNCYSTISKRFSKSTKNYSMQEIDDMFIKLSSYSQMQGKVLIDSKEADFFEWVNPVVSKLEEAKQDLEKEKQTLAAQIETNKESLKAQKRKNAGIIVLTVVACIIVSFFVTSAIVQKNNEEINKFQQELELFKQNFLHVDEIDNEYIDDLKSYVNVSDVKVTNLTDDAVSFSGKISATTDIYGIMFAEDSKYIVMTKTGKVFEYNVYGEDQQYNIYSSRFGKYIQRSLKLPQAQFYGISNKNEITYIKITKASVFEVENASRTPIKENLEIELYSK